MFGKNTKKILFSLVLAGALFVQSSAAVNAQQRFSETDCNNQKGQCNTFSKTCSSDEDLLGYCDISVGGVACCIKKSNLDSPTNKAQQSPLQQQQQQQQQQQMNAATTNALVPCGGAGQDQCTLCHIIVGFKRIFDWLMGLLFVATVLIITVAGVFYMVSSGNAAMINKAKQAMFLAITAFVIGMGCWLAVNLVMTMLGFSKAGSWWQFECDTTSLWKAASNQSGAPGTTPGTTPGNTNPQQPAGNFKGCAGVVSNIESMDGWIYTSEKNGNNNLRMTDGYGDCSSTTSRAYTNAGCKSPGSSTDEMMKSPYAQTLGNQVPKAGDSIVRKGHVGICLNDGCSQIMGASTADGIHPSSGSSMLNPNNKIIRASDLCGSNC